MWRQLGDRNNTCKHQIYKKKYWPKMTGPVWSEPVLGPIRSWTENCTPLYLFLLYLTNICKDEQIFYCFCLSFCWLITILLLLVTYCKWICFLSTWHLNLYPKINFDTVSIKKLILWVYYFEVDIHCNISTIVC